MSDNKFTIDPNLLNSIKTSFTPTYNANIEVTKTNKIIEDFQKGQAIEKDENLEYRNTVIQTLQGIEKNTAFLAEMTLLLQKNKEIQDDIFELLIEVLEIMKSPNKEEAESRYKKVMRKIGEYSGHIESIQTLYGISQTAFNAYNSLPFV